MSDRKLSMPSTVFIGPNEFRMAFKHVLFKVLSRDENGAPYLCRLINEKEQIDLQGGEEFITGYLKDAVINKPKKQDAK